MQKINLLYVVTKLELGGAQKQLLSLVRRLDKQRFNVFLFTAQDGLLLNETLSISGLKVEKSLFLERAINPLCDILALFEIYQFIKKNNIEIVHTHSSKAGILGRWAARLAGVSIILHTVHGWPFNDYQPNFLKFLFIYLERISAKFTDKIVVVSRHDMKKGLQYKIGGEDKYELVRYGIDYSEFNNADRADIRKELGVGGNELAVGMVSCFKPQKSPQDFIRLAGLVNKKMPNVKFILTGDGVLRKDIEKLIKQCNLNDKIILTGWRRDAARIFSAMDIFVLTSLWEGLPVTVLEAIAARRPVIATNTGGVAEIIEEGRTGFLVARKDMDDMAEKVSALLNNENLRKKICQNARQSLGPACTVTNMSQSYRDLYERLIRGKTGRKECGDG